MDDLINNIEIVVSRYNENLDWINEFPFNQFKYTVYNKGDNDNFEKTNVVNIIKLKNVGMCDHTNLYHIIKNYNSLSNITVFLPGSVHLKHKKEKAVIILKSIIQSNYKNAYFVGCYLNSIKKEFQYFQLDTYKGACEENNIKNKETSLFKCKIRPYEKWYEYFFGETPGHWVTLSGVFSIDKRDIIKYPIERYQNLIETLNIHSNPEAAHYMERSWGVIFYPLNNTIKIQLKNYT